MNILADIEQGTQTPANRHQDDAAVENVYDKEVDTVRFLISVRKVVEKTTDDDRT